MTPRPLFRPEALRAQAQPALGGVHLVQPLRLRSLTWVACGAAVLFLGFVFSASYTRKATVAGVVAPDLGLIRVVPPVAGTVVKRWVEEGRTVRAGDPLYELQVERPVPLAGVQQEVLRSLDERQRSLGEAASAQRALAETRRAALERRLLAVDAEATQVDREAVLQRERLGLAEQALQRLQSLQGDRFVSAAQTQAKQDDVLALRAALQTLERQRAALQRERAEIDGERRALPLLTQGAVEGLQRDRAQAERERAEQNVAQRVVLRASQDGQIGAVWADNGQAVSAGTALASLVPAGSLLQAQLYAPSSAIGFVRPGQAVRLRYEAFPYQKYGQQTGQVVQVSRTPLAAADQAGLALAAPLASEPLFRITVALDAPPAGIQPSAGLRLQADVQLERRRLVEWLFEPVLGWRQRW